MSALNFQPLLADDFSGGITDNFLPGRPNQYMVADNLIITTDRQLETRPGSEIYASNGYQVAVGERVGALISFMNETYLLAQSAQDVSYYDASTGWNKITGPAGNPALSVGFADSSVSYSEWQGHLFITNDAGSSPMKIYRDSTGTFRVRTAGLPALPTKQNIDSTTLLTQCINLANDLRSQMIGHMSDVGVFNTDLHQALDPGAATLTATAVATDAATLYTLVAALISVYTSHAADARNLWIITPKVYHFDPVGIPSSFSLPLSVTATPTTVEDAAARLDEIRSKYLRHTWDVWTHDGYNSGTILNQYQPTLAEIGTITSGIVVTPNYAELFTWANDIKAKFNAHLGDTSMHRVADTDNVVSAPDATDLESFYILAYHLRVQYTNHWNDSRSSFIAGTMDTTAGSANATDVRQPAGGGLYGAGVGSYIICANFATNTTVSASAAGTLTASANSSATTNDVVVTWTSSKFHKAQDTTTDTQISTSYLNPGTSLSEWMTLLDEMGTAYGYHQANYTAHQWFGSASLAYSKPTLNTYVYAMCFFYEYTVGEMTFQDYGPVSYSSSVQTIGASVATGTTTTPTELSNIQPLTNGSGENYDTASIKVKIYRTTDTGSTYYNLGEITNGTTTYSDTRHDTVSDPSLGTALIDGVRLYTDGGVVENDPPPKAKTLHIVNGIGYYGNITENGESLPYRVRQAIQGDPDSCPGDFYDDLDDDVVVLTSAKSNIMALCKSSLYRLEGQYNEIGQGFLTHQRITDRVGCVSVASVVQTEYGVFFAGTDGFYWTDSYQVQKVSGEFDRTYQRHTATAAQSKRISGGYDHLNSRIWWGMTSSSTKADNDVAFILNLKFWGKEGGAFTTASNGEHWKPTAFAFFQGKLLRGDARGYVFKHHDDYKTDPRVDTTLAATSWGTATIIWDFVSCATDFGNSKERKWVPRITVKAKNKSNLSLQINSINDEETAQALAAISYRGNVVWGDPTVSWGDDSVSWGFDGVIDEWRRFPAASMRCDYKQVELTNAYVILAKSDTYGLAATAASVGSSFNVTLTPSTGYAWPTQPHDYYIYFDSDSYATGYKITSRTSDTVVVCDGSSMTLVSNRKWIIKGYPKGERFSLVNYTMHFSYLGRNQKTYGGATAEGLGGNA